MAKRRTEEQPASRSPKKQVNVKMTLDLAERLDLAAIKLGIDTSNLLRMMITEKLPEYEERGCRAQRHPCEGQTPATSNDPPADEISS